MSHTENNAAHAKPSPEVVSGIDLPVVFADTEIFVVTNSPVSSLSPANRAKLIEQNIQIFADGKEDSKELKINKLPDGLGIGSESVMLMVISEQDAKNAGKKADELACQVLEHLKTTVESDRKKHNWKIYGLGAAFTLLSNLALWQDIFWNNRAFSWLTKKVPALRKYWKNGFHLKEIEVLSAKRIEHIILFILNFFRTLILLLCLYFFLPLTLSFFPETRHLGASIFDYLITPFQSIFHALINVIPNLFYIFVIIVIAKYVLKLIFYVFTLIETGELEFEWFYDDWARPTYQIIRFLVIVTALISVYPYIPCSSSNAFQGVGLVLGAIISFASSSAISNIVAGIILTYTRAFKLNDRIKVGDSTGDVVEKILLVIRIQTVKEVIVTILNSLVMSSQIINFSTSAAEGEGLILHSTVTIGYDVPYQKVQSLLIDAALATEGIHKTPIPYVLQTSLGDWYVSYEINGYTQEPHRMASIYSNLHQNILQIIDKAGVKIMSPHYFAVRDGNPSTVPSVLTAKGYTPPSFQVNSPTRNTPS